MACTFLTKDSMRPFAFNRGFTLVELMVSMSIGTVVMLAVFSTYLYLGRSLTRLSYRSALEGQSRKILNTFATDIRNALSVANPPAANPSASSLSLKMRDGSTVVYDFSVNQLSRNAGGSGAVVLNNNIGDSNVQVPVTMNNFSFLYYTTSGGNPVSQFTAPAPPITPISIKQVALSFTLQAGVPAIQGQQGTLTRYPVTSRRMSFINRPLLDGN